MCETVVSIYVSIYSIYSTRIQIDAKTNTNGMETLKKKSTVRSKTPDKRDHCKKQRLVVQSHHFSAAITSVFGEYIKSIHQKKTCQNGMKHRNQTVFALHFAFTACPFHPSNPQLWQMFIHTSASRRNCDICCKAGCTSKGRKPQGNHQWGANDIGHGKVASEK